MNRHVVGTVSFVVVSILAAGLAAQDAAAATLKHRQTGEVIKGTLTDQRINNLAVFKPEGGGTKFINLAEWDVLEADKPPEPAPPEKAPAGGAAPAAPEGKAPAEPEAAAREVRPYVIPISGPIVSPCLLDGLQKALTEARTARVCQEVAPAFLSGVTRAREALSLFVLTR